MKLQANQTFRDKEGNIVVWQSPNWLLWSWIILNLLGLILNEGRLNTGIEQLSIAILIAWAYGEAATGVNYFRKVLGVIVLSSIVLNFEVKGASFLCLQLSPSYLESKLLP